MRASSFGLWMTLALVLLIEGAQCTHEQLAYKYAPKLRFDNKAGHDDGYCFPSDAGEYYDLRMAGQHGRLCNMDYSTLQNGVIPTYWHAQVCGHHLHIAYWSFFGYNHNCDLFNGERDAWFTSLVVKIRDYDMDERIHEVRYSQKEGWYTRIPGRYETTNATHPYAYVGKSVHGFFHDDGGSGTCCYYEDFRNPGKPDQYMNTWLNLKELDGSSEWMTDTVNDVWSGIDSPMQRDDWDLCSLNGCTGAYVWLCSTCGCYKSDIGSDPF